MTENKKFELISCVEKLRNYCISREDCYSDEHPEYKCIFWHDKFGCILRAEYPQNYPLDTLIKSDNRLITADEIRERCKGGLD